MPAQPQPISLGPPSVVGSVLGYIGSFTAVSAGDQIDALRTSSFLAHMSVLGVCVADYENH